MHKHMVILQGLVDQNSPPPQKNPFLSWYQEMQIVLGNLCLRFTPPSQYSGGEQNFITGAQNTENMEKTKPKQNKNQNH